MMPIIKQFEHLKIQLEAIKSATNNFANDKCIGRGGFGKVYSGELVHSKGQSMVAIKRLDSTFGQGNPEFWKEIIMLSLYKHENIVSLVGFCDESDEKLLVYEYASRKSLDLYLNSDNLTWIRRLKISIGAARGLAYLHSPGSSQQRVLHRDIKSSNILLDESWNARISDLGLSKFGPANQQYTFLVSNAVGTIGYCDPIYVETGLLTKESDVYSFGVVLFEILCGRLCIDNTNNYKPPLTGLVRRFYQESKMNEIIHDDIKDEIKPNSLKEFIAIAYQCLDRDKDKRPLMTEVVSRLETALKLQEGTEAASSFLRSLDFKQREMELCLIGIQNSGKTSLLNLLATGQYSDKMISTSRFDVKNVTRGNINMKIWDYGGQARFRNMWRRYCSVGTSAIVYVVDAADQDNIIISMAELHDLIGDNLRPVSSAPLLVLGNKIDKPDAISEQALREKMNLSSITDREVSCLMISCKESTNIDLVIDWLVKHS